MDKNIIGLYSKRQEFTGHPQYYKKAKGCYVWAKKDDKLRVKDNQKFLDMSTMGIGTCLLGYNNTEVNNAVKKAIKAGNMSSLHPEKEVELADMLCAIEPWASHVRFARSGGEAMAMAYRIACAVTGKKGFIHSGYHGWQLEENENDLGRFDINHFGEFYELTKKHKHKLS
jgi:glutamate-1-semialdehyde 2,1-aminomutase